MLTTILVKVNLSKNFLRQNFGRSCSVQGPLIITAGPNVCSLSVFVHTYVSIYPVLLSRDVTCTLSPDAATVPGMIGLP
jgi:hypothetical protein